MEPSLELEFVLRIESNVTDQFMIPASSAVADSEVKVHVEVSFMFEQETIHLGAIELLRECFWSSKKKNKPLPRKHSCMHRAPYQEHTELCCFYLQPPAISEGESL
ncbi:hypothetical protein TSUD_323430 [Trifolium subterraneum]|uniref:Uncharacterized protein n=1 Tax=Trifolium subterraneum TaxID=3900 RepID=A0A2Z6MJH4_TRISU|nr:hypothetical protein TSUD_323430 [Trifolium subterraneum]